MDRFLRPFVVNACIAQLSKEVRCTTKCWRRSDSFPSVQPDTSAHTQSRSVRISIGVPISEAFRELTASLSFTHWFK